MPKYIVNFFDKINLKIKKNNISYESFCNKINSKRTRRAKNGDGRRRKGLMHESARDCQTN